MSGDKKVHVLPSPAEQPISPAELKGPVGFKSTPAHMNGLAVLQLITRGTLEKSVSVKSLIKSEKTPTQIYTFKTQVTLNNF